MGRCRRVARKFYGPLALVILEVIVPYNAGFTHCCTARIIYDFPWDPSSPTNALKKAKVFVEKAAKASFQDGDAVLVATLTTKQEKSKDMLVNMGFICSEPMKKKRHSDRDLYVLYLPLAKWMEGNKKVIPRDAKGRFIKANPFT